MATRKEENKIMIRLTEVTENNWVEVAGLSVKDSPKSYVAPVIGILDEVRKEGHYDHVEVCVKKDDIPAIHLYQKKGFVDSGYIDEEVPDSLNMICYLS